MSPKQQGHFLFVTTPYLSPSNVAARFWRKESISSSNPKAMSDAFWIPMDRSFSEHQTNLEQYSPHVWTVASIALIYTVYLCSKHFDVAILSPPELIWNAIVFLTPYRLVLLLTRRFGSNDAFQRMETHANRSEQHAMKAEAIRNLAKLHGWGKAVPLDHQTLGSPRPPRKASNTSKVPPGLGNWDNSCYQNSVLQGLSSLDCLKDYLLAFPQPAAPTDSSTIGSLREITSKLNGFEFNGKKIWTPAKLKSMSSWQQQDAQEYYSKILDEVDKESMKVMAERPSQNGGLKALLEPVRRFAASHSHQSAANELHGNPLEGLMAQRIACTSCAFSEGLSLSPFNCLTVPLGSRSDYNVEDCLDAFTDLEEISGVECVSCTLRKGESTLSNMLNPSKDESKEVTETTLPLELERSVSERLQNIRAAIEESDFSDNTLQKKCMIGKKSRVSSTKTRQAVIARPPKALVIHINRSVFDEYTGAQRKNYAEVRYPSTLRMRPWILGSEIADDNDAEQWTMRPTSSMTPVRTGSRASRWPAYRLRAVVTHLGRHENGHYVCYRQHNLAQNEFEKGTQSTADPQQWWRLSDQDVSAVSESEALVQRGAFMLFYERESEEPLPMKDKMILKASAKNLEPSVPATEAITSGAKPKGAEIVDADSAQERDETQPAREHQTADKLHSNEALTESRADKGGNATVLARSHTVKPSSPSTMKTSRSKSKRKSSNFGTRAPTIAAT